ncbi:ABC transporter permease [Alicyclobacillus sp. SO9]|uniref:ABC transporter permease n=1 Tax=Alicyclobacillus sp. SO9 TaxID=2665646 RepID=UPI0018E8027A|nr:ABC transporter permease [Alicyclobacillus sp. SO9]QQE80390.1 ABC transporter permease [Alicyclobacillus sp. SO9]
MFGYVIRRLGGAVVSLWGVTVITFIIAYAVPADPARTIAGPKAPPSVIHQIRVNLGLNLPLPVQYWHYLVRLVHGNLGTSYVYHLPVAHMIMQRAGATIELAFGCWIAELVIGIPLGIYTALHARKISDYLVSAIALIGISLPVFWLGLELMYYFAFQLSWFPLGGYGGIRHLILPSITYGITGAAIYIRLLKAQMLEVLNQDYTRTARAKGATDRRVVLRHVLRNALIPVVTFGGIDIGFLLAGVVLIEATFNWNGLGMLAYQAVQQLDIPVIMGTVILIAMLVVLFNLFVDLLYGVIDPRIRYD